MTTDPLPCSACGHDDPHFKNDGCGIDLMQEGPPPYFVQCMCDGKSGSRIVRFWTAEECPACTEQAHIPSCDFYREAPR